MIVCEVEFIEKPCVKCGAPTINNQLIGPHCGYCWEVRVLKYDTGKYGNQSDIKN